MNPKVLAGVCFYPTDLHKRGLGKGKNDDSLARVREIRAEMLMIFAARTPMVPREGRSMIYDAMSDAAIHFTWHESTPPTPSSATRAPLRPGSRPRLLRLASSSFNASSA